MRAGWRGLAAVGVLALLAAACTGGGEATDPTGPTADATDPGEAAATAEPEGTGDPAEDPTAAAEADPMALPAPQATGSVPFSDDELVAIADTWIAGDSGLSDMLREEIAFDRLVRSGRVAHLTYVQAHDDVTVRGATFIVHVRDDGSVQNASNSLRTVLPAEDSTVELSEAEAIDIATKAVTGTLSGEPQVVQTWVQRGDALRLGWQVAFSTRDPFASWAVVVDAGSGDVLAVDPVGATVTPGGGSRAHAAAPQLDVAQASEPACDLRDDGPGACVFLVDPLYGTGASSPDAVDEEDTDAALVGVALQNLADPDVLAGTYAQLGPEIIDRLEIDGALGERGRGTDDETRGEFAAGMAYFWVDYAQRQLQRLGITDLHSEDPIDIYPVVTDLPDNAFFDFIADGMFLGFATNTDRLFAEDASAIIHEYGHALVNDGVGLIFSGEGGAFHEGFADVFALLTTLELRNGDTGCLTQWVTVDCLRRLDADSVYPDDLVFEPHLDGQIYAGAIWTLLELRLAEDDLTIADCVVDRRVNPCGAARDELLLTAAASLGYLTPELGLADAAEAFALADEAQLGGANADLIVEAFGQHGLSTDGGQSTNNGSEVPEMTTSGSEGAIEIEIRHSYRGDLDVDLVVVDAAGEPLCQASVFEPDAGDGEDDLSGILDLAGSGCEALLPPSPDRVWGLIVADTLEADTGQLFTFTVLDGATPYPAPGLPLPIPDADPEGVVAVVDGSTGAEPEEDVLGGEEADPDIKVPGAETMAPEPPGTLSVEIGITHPYRGDLQVIVGVLDPATEQALCSVTLFQPDPSDDGDDIRGTADVSDCAAAYPPDAGHIWIALAVDNAAIDEGTLDLFRLIGPDGSVFEAVGPAPIPDNDPGGAGLVITG